MRPLSRGLDSDSPEIRSFPQGNGLKNLVFLAFTLLISSLAFSNAPDIRISYGEPGPTAGTGFADLEPVERSAADQDVRDTLINLEQLIHASLIGENDSKTRLIIDVAADHLNGPITTVNDEVRTGFRVRLKVQRHRAVFEHRIYEIESEGDTFRQSLLAAVEDFLTRPKVAKLMGYDSSQALALN